MDQGNAGTMENVFVSPVLTIRGNIIEWGRNRFTQISNITQVWTGRTPHEDLSLKKTACLVLSVGVLYFLGAAFFSMKFVPIWTFLVFSLVFFSKNYIKKYIYESYESFALNIEVSSGKVYSFISLNSKFIEKAFRVLGNVMRDKTILKNDINIDMKEGIVQLVAQKDMNIIDSIIGDNATIDKSVSI